MLLFSFWKDDSSHIPRHLSLLLENLSIYDLMTFRKLRHQLHKNFFEYFMSKLALQEFEMFRYESKK